MIHEFVKLTFKKFKQEPDAELYKNLIREEVDEFFEAGSLPEQVKEAVDILWVVIGWLIASIGYNNTLKAYREVYLSNMSKVCLTQKQAEDSIEKYKDKNVDCIYEKHTDEDGEYYVIYDSKSGKYKKGINYTKANMTWLLD